MMTLKDLEEWRHEPGRPPNVDSEKLRDVGKRWIVHLRKFEEAWKNHKQVRFTKEFDDTYNIFGACQHVGDVIAFLVHFLDLEEEE